MHKEPEMSENDTQAHDKLRSLIQDIGVAMVTTRNNAGALLARPLANQIRKDDHDPFLWFFVARDSETHENLKADPSIGVAYADTDDDRYVAVSGRAEAVDDADEKRARWSRMNEAWFPQGPESDDVVLLRVSIDRGEYWDRHANKVVQLFEMAAAVVTQRPPSGLGDHGSVVH
jgi:general stress protein 26